MGKDKKNQPDRFWFEDLKWPFSGERKALKNLFHEITHNLSNPFSIILISGIIGFLVLYVWSIFSYKFHYLFYIFLGSIAIFIVFGGLSFGLLFFFGNKKVYTPQRMKREFKSTINILSIYIIVGIILCAIGFSLSYLIQLL